MAPFIRIFMRYAAGFLIARGYADGGTANAMWQDEQLIGSLALIISEGWYFAARKFDWVT